MSQDHRSSFGPSPHLASALAASLFGLGLLTWPLAAGSQGWDDPIEAGRGADAYAYEPPAPQQDRLSEERIEYADHVGWGVRLGLGLVADPNSFLVDLAIPYNTGGGVSVGPRIQLGLSEDITFVAPTLSVEYAHDLRSQLSGPFAKVRPLIQVGIGFSSLEKDGILGKNDDVAFLVDIGAGVEYPLTDGFAIASVVDFNILPRESLDQTLIFTWQILQVRLQF